MWTDNESQEISKSIIFYSGKCIILLGDFNAKIGRQEMFRSIIGKFSLHEQCSDHERCEVDFATSNGQLSTLFVP